MSAALDPRVLAALRDRPELVDVVLRLAEPAPVRIGTAADAAAVFAGLLAGRETEALACAALDRRGNVIDVAILTTGTDGATIIDGRQILRWVLTRKRAAVAFLVAHNHPSGDPEPSHEDRAATRRVKEAAVAVGLQLHDHVVIGSPGRWASFALRGEL